MAERCLSSGRLFIFYLSKLIFYSQPQIFFFSYNNQHKIIKFIQILLIAVYPTEKTSHMFGPLNFPTHESSKYKSQFTGLDDEPEEIKCFLCDAGFTLPNNQKDMLTHIFKEHRLVIGDVEKISSLKRC